MSETYSNTNKIYTIDDEKSYTNEEIYEMLRTIKYLYPTHHNILDNILELDSMSESYIEDISKYTFDSIDITDHVNNLKLDLIIAINKMQLSVETELSFGIIIKENWSSKKGIMFKRGYYLSTDKFINLCESRKKKIIDALIDNGALDNSMYLDIYIDLVSDTNYRISKFNEIINVCVSKENFEMAILYRDKIKEINKI